MPTRKQRRRTLKERRHEQAWYSTDEFGNEVEVDAPEKEERSVEPTAKGTAGQKKQGGGSRPIKVPPQPSWSRAVKRAGLIGVVIFVAFYLVGSRNGSHRLSSALLITVVYTAIFVPFTYWIDGFTYRRWQRRAEQQGPRRQVKSR
jgi:hypothetical protein